MMMRKKTSITSFLGGLWWAMVAISATTKSLTLFVTQVAAEETSKLLSYPKYTLVPLNYSISYRQDICDRQRAFHNGSVTLKDALGGLDLTVFFLNGVDSLGVSNSDGSTPFDSKEPSIRVLDALAERAKFTWRNSYGVADISDAMRNDGQGEAAVDLDNVLTWAANSFDLTGNGGSPLA
jgi:hypothetical protein